MKNKTADAAPRFPLSSKTSMDFKKFLRIVSSGGLASLPKVGGQTVLMAAVR
jgi:hypothetical protein